MVAQPDRDPAARREEALARLAVTTEALHVLEEAVAAEADLPDPTAQALLSGARALCPVAASTGAELTVSAGPHPQWSVVVGSGPGGPQLRLQRAASGSVWTPPPPRPLDPTPAAPPSADLLPADLLPADPPPADVAGQLAELLRTGPGTGTDTGAPR